MLTVIDGRGAVRYRGTGIGTYTHNLIAGLIETRQPADSLLVCLPFAAEPRKLWPAAGGGEGRGRGRGVHFWRLGDGDDEAATREIAEVCARAGADLLHLPQNGRDMPDVACRVITTIHDLIPLYLPQTCSPRYLRDMLAQYAWIVHRSDRLIAVSRFTASCLAEALRVPPERIEVVHEAAAAAFWRPPAGDDLAAARARLGLPDHYLLHVGGTGLRKNIATVIQALALLRAARPPGADLPHLVLGGKPGLDQDHLAQCAKHLEISPLVHAAGMIAAADLPAVYAGARAVVCASLHEGFSLPVLEGMAAGTPVVASAIAVHREIAGAAALYFDPLDPGELAAVLRQATWHGPTRRVLTAAGRGRAAEYNWRRAARETWLAYRWAVT